MWLVTRTFVEDFVRLTKLNSRLNTCIQNECTDAEASQFKLNKSICELCHGSVALTNGYSVQPGTETATNCCMSVTSKW